MEERRCHCGKPLHYTNPEIKGLVEEAVSRLGENIAITQASTGRKFLVPRHFIALHGLKTTDLSTLGFLELNA